jgi:hypothetical protein
MATTTLDLIKQALLEIRVIAAGDTPSAEDAADAKKKLNQMLDYWTLDGLMSHCLINDLFDLTIGIFDYTIGLTATAGNFITSRPICIENAFIKNDDVDSSIAIINNAEYQGIINKTITGLPTQLMYNPSYLLGHIFLWPVPDATYKINITHKIPFTQLTILTQKLLLPEGYELAIINNLAVLLAPGYGKSISSETFKTAVDTKAAIKRANMTTPILEHELGNHGGAFGFDINAG